MPGTQVPTVLRFFEGTIAVTPHTVVARRPTQAEAFTEACRRLSIMADKPDSIPWRMRVNKAPDGRWTDAPWVITAVQP